MPLSAMMATPLAQNTCQVSNNEGYQVVFSCGAVYPDSESYIEQVFHEVLFIILCKGVLTFKSVDKL